MSRFPAPQVVVALDYANAAEAVSLARQLDPARCRLKVGKELFTAAGPALLDQLQALGFHLFLDLKFHDIPNTVAAALRAAASLGVWMVNVHASGGRRMLEAAAEACAAAASPPLLIGVTVLTSMDEADLAELGHTETLPERVAQLAQLCADCGLGGVVCSAQEAPALRAAHGDAFCLVTPGIRPAGAAHADQRRVVTPQQALALGADYLVIGRAITGSADPAAALQAILGALHAES